MDQPKLERLLRLMKMLTANDRYTIDDLSDRLDMSRRTIYRYIDTFREAGFVIKKSGNFTRIDKSSPYFKDISELVHFTEEEAWILKSAIESIDENNMLKQQLKKKLYSVYDYKVLADTVVKGENARNVHKIIEAIEEKKRIVLKRYSSSNSDVIRDRIVEPHAFTTNYIQLWAYEPQSGENKLFKIARISAVEIAEDSWENEERHEKLPIDIFRFSSKEQLPIKLRLNLRAYNLLIEEYPLSENFLTPEGDNSWIFETTVGNYEGPCRFVMGLIGEIEIIGSEEFRQFVRERAESSFKKI